MEDKEYVQSLENLLVFMCQTYEEQQGVVRELAKEGNKEPLMRIPKIQGYFQLSAIRELSEMDFNVPQHSFKDVVDKMKSRPGGD